MSKLTNRPEGRTYKERLLRHLERERLAKPWLRLLVEGLHVLLLWSIGLFVTGLLYQLWNLGGSFEERIPRLLVTWGLGVALSLAILMVVLGASMHALIYEASPFGGPFSRLLLRAGKRMAESYKPWMKQVEKTARWLEGTYPWSSRVFRHVVAFIARAIAGPLWVSFRLLATWRVELELDDKKQLCTTYMRLIAEASDPKLLERAIGSFSYSEWFDGGKGSADELEKTYNRLMATDTSVRVRETIRVRLSRFVPSTSQGLRELGDKFTKEHTQLFFAIHSYPQHFRDRLLEASFRPDNTDLRCLSLLPFEECVGRVLCSYNQEEKLGDRWRILALAENHCYNLLDEGEVDDVQRILSHVNPVDLIQSFIQHPSYLYSSIVELVAKNRKHELLREVNQFVNRVRHSRLSPSSLSRVCSVLASPPPTDIDLSPLIDYLSRYPYYHTWKHTSNTMTIYLTAFGLSKCSDGAGVRRFLDQCVDTEFRDEDGDPYPTNDETRARARDLLAGKSSLSLLLHSIDRTRRARLPPFSSHRRHRLYIHSTSISISISNYDPQRCLTARLDFPGSRRYRVRRGPDGRHPL